MLGDPGVILNPPVCKFPPNCFRELNNLCPLILEALSDGSSALKGRLGWLTLLPSVDEKGKARSWDKHLALAQDRNEKAGAAVASPAAALHTCTQNICAQL